MNQLLILEVLIKKALLGGWDVETFRENHYLEKHQGSTLEVLLRNAESNPQLVGQILDNPSFQIAVKIFDQQQKKRERESANV
jgi:hypothetical protein